MDGSETRKCPVVQAEAEIPEAIRKERRSEYRNRRRERREVGNAGSGPGETEMRNVSEAEIQQTVRRDTGSGNRRQSGRSRLRKVQYMTVEDD